MRGKYLLLFLIFIIVFSIPVQAQNVELSYIQKLINNQKRDKALKILEESEIESNPDLRFYQALLLSWNDEFKKSEEIILNLIEEHPDRFDFYDQLARLYGWMDKPYKALEYREKAYEKAKGSDYEKDYLKLLKKARQKIKPTNFGKLELLYEVDDNEGIFITNVLLGQDRIISNNIDLTGAAGFSYTNNNSNYLLRTSLKLKSFNLIKDFNFENSNNIIIAENKTKFNIYNNFNYKIDARNNLALNLNSFHTIKDKESSNYQNINLEYKHNWDKLVGIIGTTARRADSSFNFGFSENIQIYYPLDKYLVNMQVTHYQDDEYVFRAGVELDNLELNSNWVIGSLNSWINNKKSSFLSLKFLNKDR